MTRLRILGSLLAWNAFAPLAAAGLYSPIERCQIPVREDGTAEELSFGSQKEGTFPQLFSTLLNELDANPLRTENPERQRVLNQIAEWKSRPKASLSASDVAGIGTALVRIGKLDDAVALLAPHRQDRTPDFRLLADLAHVHAARGEWDDARNAHRDAFELADFPSDLSGTTPAQRTWLKALEQRQYRQWLRVHTDRTAAKTRPQDEDVFPLFQVRFVNDGGVYQSGTLAESERAKLPLDAIPVVQQLLLWAPWDTGLYWLLAELYAANGRLREAEVIFNQCADGRQFSNRPIFMAHRAAIREAVSKLPPEKPTEEPLLGSATPPEPKSDPAAFLPSREKVAPAAVAFVALIVGMAALQVRAVRRRRKEPK